MTCWIDSEPLGDGAWRVSLNGPCDRRLTRRLYDEARGLALVGAKTVDISLEGVTYLDSNGARAIGELCERMGLLGIDVHFDGIVAEIEAQVALRADGGSWSSPS